MLTIHPEKIYISSANADMRKSIDGLSAIVKENFKLNQFGNAPAERQRMIICKLFKEILVGKGYSVQILMDSCMSSF